MTMSESSTADRRLDPRQPSEDAVKLVTRGGHVFDAVMVDRSLRGLRLQLGEAGTIPSEVTVLARSMGAVFMAQVVWRTPPYVGLAITSSVDVRKSSGPESAGIRKLWREHISA